MGKKRLRRWLLSSIGVSLLLVLGQGVALASEGPASSLDDTTDAVTDVVDDTTDAVTDVVDDTTDSVTDVVNDSTDAVSDTVDDPVGAVADAVDATVDQTAGAVEGASGENGASVEGTVDSAAETAGGSGSTAPAAASTRPRGHEGSLGTRAPATTSSDLDELAQGGNDVIEGPGGATCVGIADVVCLDLVGGLGAFGILFRAVEEARDVVSPFADSLASTGRDLLGPSVMLIALTLAGIALTSRRSRPTAPPARGRARVRT